MMAGYRQAKGQGMTHGEALDEVLLDGYACRDLRYPTVTCQLSKSSATVLQ
jgi:hypothetical protein